MMLVLLSDTDYGAFLSIQSLLQILFRDDNNGRPKPYKFYDSELLLALECAEESQEYLRQAEPNSKGLGVASTP